jgi:putative DNA primase/helicase
MADANNGVSMERARSALSFINPNDRQEWVEMGMAIKSEFGDAGFDMWDEWGSSATGKTKDGKPAWNASASRSVWKSIHPNGGKKIGSLLYKAKAAGWVDDSTYKKPTRAEIKKRNDDAAARNAQYEAEEAVRAAAASDHAKALYVAATVDKVEDHPYLKAKGVKAHGGPDIGVRVGRFVRWNEDAEAFETSTENGLLVPVHDAAKKMQSLQCIFPDGKKLHLKDGVKQGNFFHIGGKPLVVDGHPVFALCEGYATGASVYESTQHCVLVCWDAGNIIRVATDIRTRRPDATILVLSDNDCESTINTGLIAAQKTAAAVGAVVAVPVGADPSKSCDFNDVHQTLGPLAVEAIITSALLKPAAPTPIPDNTPLPTTISNDTETGPVPVMSGAAVDKLHDIDDAIEYKSHFNILGYDKEDFYIFVSGKRQILCIRGAALATDATLLQMAPLEWWAGNFPKKGGGAAIDDPEKKMPGIDKMMVLDWFFKRANTKGVFDISVVRGRGAWVDAGRVVFHHGDHLTVDGQHVAIHQMNGAYKYELAKKLPLPSDTPLTDADGQKLVEIAKMFSWAKPGSSYLLAGWTFLAPVCGALRWRPHIWMVGAAGSGKSTIQNDYVHRLLGAMTVYAQGNSTEAGFRQTLKADALPVLFDEAEQNDDSEKKRVQNIISLVRQSSTESYAKTLKGTIGGDAMDFHIRSMFCFSSVQAGLERQADTDRMALLSIRKENDIAKAAEQWDAIKESIYTIERDKDISGRLLARAIAMLPITHQNIATFVTVAAKSMGSQRRGDQYGTLLAGAWSLMHSEPATEEQAQKLIETYDWSDIVDSGQMDDSDAALQALLESKIISQGYAYPVGTLIERAEGNLSEGPSMAEKEASDLLRHNGIAVSADGKYLLVAGQGSVIGRLINNQAYAADFKGLIMRLPGALKWKDSVRLAGSTRRAVAIPMVLIRTPEPITKTPTSAPLSLDDTESF